AMAVNTLSAAHHGGDHNFLADVQPPSHTWTDLVNSSHNLMPGNRRRHDVLLPVGVNALVRPAHGTAEDSQNNLPWSNRGLRNLLDPHVSRPVKNCCLHRTHDLSPASEGVKKSDWPSVAALYERRSH